MNTVATTWGEGDARVSVGDTVVVFSQHDRRGSPQRTGVVTKIGRKLLHVRHDGWASGTYYLADQSATGQWSGSYRTLAQQAVADRRAAADAGLAELGIGPSKDRWRGGWSDWATEHLEQLLECARRIRGTGAGQ